MDGALENECSLEVDHCPNISVLCWLTTPCYPKSCDTMFKLIEWLIKRQESYSRNYMIFVGNVIEFNLRNFAILLTLPPLPHPYNC